MASAVQGFNTSILPFSIFINNRFKIVRILCIITAFFSIFINNGRTII